MSTKSLIHSELQLAKNNYKGVQMRTIAYADVKTIPFERVLEHYGIKLEAKVIKDEKKLVGSCPIHKHDGPTNPRSSQFQVTLNSPDHPKTNNTFMCFGCWARGTIVDFVVLMEGWVKYDEVDWREVKVKRESGEKFNWVSEEDLKLASRLLQKWFIAGKDMYKKADKIDTSKERVQTVNTSEAPKTLVNATWIEMWGSPAKYHKSFVKNQYLASRGISEATLAEFGVGYYWNPKAKSQLLGRIIFPLQNTEGEHIGYASRAVDENEPRYIFPPAEREREKIIYKFDRSVLLWNFHRATEEKDVVVVEGFFGCMNVHQHGYPGVVALMGSNLTEAQAELIADHFQSATFLIDPDEPGLKLAKQAMDLVRGRTLLKLIFPSIQPDQMTEDQIKTLLR